MIKNLLLSLLLLLTLSCAKTQGPEINIESKKVLDFETIKSFYGKSYDFKIRAEKQSIVFQESGYRDISGNIFVNGFMEIIGEEKLEYSHFFDGQTWYSKKSMAKELYNQPIDPLSIIENSIINEPILIKNSNNEYVFEAEINVAVIDPLNYSAKGTMKTDASLSYIKIEAKNDGMSYSIELHQKHHSPIKFPKEIKSKYTVSGGGEDIELFKKRIEDNNIGSMKYKTASLYYDEFRLLKRILEEDTIELWVFEYSDPSLNGDSVAYIKWDERNSIKKTMKISTLCLKEYEITMKGKKYDIEFKDVSLDANSNIAVSFGDLAFRADYEELSSALILSGLSEVEMLSILSVNQNPYKENSLILNQEE